jgi:hypothetical protein
LGKWQKRSPHVCQPNAAGGAVKQDNPNFIFKSLHPRTHGWLRDVQGICSAPKTAAASGFQECL